VAIRQAPASAYASRVANLRLPTLAGCAALYCVSIVVLLESHLGQGWGFVDLTVYRYGGQAVLRGADLYDLRFPGALAFTYPPISALIFTVLTRASMAVLEPLLSAANLLLLPLMLLLALRLRPLSASLSRERAIRIALLSAALALWLEPVWSTLRYGQIDLLIGTLILWDLSRPEGSRWKGLALGLAIALKLTPVIFVAYLLLSGRVRSAALALVSFLCTVALGFALIPRDSLAYWGGAFLDSRRVGRIENAANQSLHGAYARLLHSVSVDAIWLSTAALVGLAGLTLAVVAARRGDDVLGVSLCALTGLLISPISWSHHWVLAVPAMMLFAIAAQGRGSRGGLLATVAVALVGWSHMIWWVPVNHPRHSELHLDALQLLYADAYVLIAMVAIAASAYALGRARRSSAPAEPPAWSPRAWRASRVWAR
jgi:alpha-1,2-mannosyltransferase